MPPIHHELNLTTQAILTYASWALTAVIFGLAVRLGVRERTPLYPLMVLAAMVGAFAEPLYDVAMMLYFYSGSHMWTHFTSFDIPQPIWTHSGYVVLYASAAMLIARDAYRGHLTRKKLFRWAAVELVMSCAFEMFGVNGISGGAYSYWGPHVLRIAQYPLVIGVLEASQVVCFGVAAARLRARSTAGWQLLGVFVIFPATFFMANFGAGWPTIIALHLHTVSPALVAVGSLASICLAVILVGLAGWLVPADRLRGDAKDRPRGFGQHDAQPVLSQAGVVEQR